MASVVVSKVHVPDGRRPLGGVQALADSMAQVGLLNPITITHEMVLVAGYHRLEAAKVLGWDRIEANIVTVDDLRARLIEIDENLIRNELTELEQAEQHRERKEILEAIGAVRKHGGDRKSSPHREDLKSYAEKAAQETGASRQKIERAVKIGSLPDEVRDAIRTTEVANNQSELLRLARLEKPKQVEVAERIATGKAKTVRQALNQEVAEEIASEPAPMPQGPFRVVVADPPWRYEKRVNDASHRSGLPYPDMSVEEICGLPVEKIAHRDAILWLWTTNAFMRDAFDVADAWGFTPKTILTWVKDRMGTGDWLRGQTEHCIMAVRGKPTVTLSNQTTVLHGPLREHSRKPDEFYALVEALCPGSKVEVFARQPRDGWSAWGAETEKFGG